MLAAMAELSFFDSHVALDPRRVTFRGQDWTTRAVVDRLAECGVREGLAYHLTGIEDNPVVGNARILDELKVAPGFHPVWAMLPFGTRELGTAEELRRAIAVSSVKAVLLYAADQKFSVAEWCCGDLYALLEDMRMPVFTRCNPADFSWEELHDLLVAHPRLPVVLRNVGYTVDRCLYPLLERCPNLHVETTRYFPFRGIEEVARLFGAERLLFGTEAPYLSPGSAVTHVLMADVPDADRRLIAGDNLRRLVQGIVYG